MKKYILVTALFLSLSNAAAKPAHLLKNKMMPDPTPLCTQLRSASVKGTPLQRLNNFYAAQWKATMVEFPEYATYAGYPGQNDRWTDISLAAIERRKKEAVCTLQIFSKIPSRSLKGEDKINYELATRNFEMAVEGQLFFSEYLVMDQLGGLQLDLADTVTSMPTANKKDYENILSRLAKVPLVEEQTEALMREGLKRHVTAVKMFLSRVPGQFDKVLTAKIEDSPLYKPFTDLNSNLNATDKADLQSRARQILQSQVFPSLQKLKEFVVTVYIPGARETIAMSDLPNGKAWYTYMVKAHTTTNMTPDELHELGLKEVGRIQHDMEKVRDEAKFKGDLKAFNKFLLSDKRFYFDDKDQLLAGYRDIAKRIDPELIKEFKTLPRLTYGVREMPAYKATEAPAAYYTGGSVEGGRPGYFEANTYDLKARPKWAMEALTLHEAVPGHHLQISLAQELKDLPEFRKYGNSTAFVEGWGLYAEGLGADVGLYKDPYSQYGQLSFEIWRAIRLVVDTGMHAKGWSRQQAIDYFQNNMAKSLLETEVEVDRYISMPGQALAYKVGQLKFRELRERAKAALGDKFDMREFHDELLRHGSLPMDVLEKSFNEWLEGQKSKLTKANSIEAINNIMKRPQK